jgi:hypothetical protein
MTALPADQPAANLDERLGAWFQAMVDAPVPERLLRHLDQLMRTKTDPKEPA